MAETAKLGLPLVAGNQAQKHVTVNEAFARIDALTQLRLESISETSPPGAPLDGQVWAVPDGATGDWAGEDGSLAVTQNGGWAFVTAAVGWAGFVGDLGVRAMFDGVAWVPGLGSATANGAGVVFRSVEVDHAVATGATSVISGLLPASAIVYGLTGRVLADIGGAATFRIGVSGADDRYGSGIGVGAGAWLQGLTSSPLAYYSATDVLLSADGGAFDGTGALRLAVHYADLTLPRG